MTSANTRAVSGRRGTAHFVIALASLGLIAAGIYLFKAPISQPVPWPDSVVVTDSYEMISLPDEIGPFRLPDKNGRVTLKEDVLKSLGLDTSYDRMRQPQRRSGTCSESSISWDWIWGARSSGPARSPRRSRASSPATPFPGWQPCQAAWRSRSRRKPCRDRDHGKEHGRVCRKGTRVIR